MLFGTGISVFWFWFLHRFSSHVSPISSSQRPRILAWWRQWWGNQKKGSFIAREFPTYCQDKVFSVCVNQCPVKLFAFSHMYQILFLFSNIVKDILIMKLYYYLFIFNWEVRYSCCTLSDVDLCRSNVIIYVYIYNMS